jgi:sulfide dehydrogenase [flavocytochrome c] flavoprotein subunit
VRRRDFLGLTALASVAPFARVAATSIRAAPRIVIVGGGFGGSACALHLKRIDPSIDITLIDPDDRYVTCPLSNEALVGLRSIASLTISRDGLRRAGVRYVRARANAIDAERRRVRLDDGSSLDFDRCVVAPGIRFLWNTPEGYDEAAAELMPHAWKAGHQTALLAARLRSMHDGGTVAISVPAGLMRCPPGPYERASLIAEFLKRHKPRSKVIILDSNNHFPRQDVFSAEWDASYRDIIEWIPSTEGGAIVGVDARRGIVHTSRGAQRVAVANIIPPQAPDAIAVESGLASGHGWCPVRPLTFESQNIARVHVIGDACVAGAMPKSASAAASQAKQCAAAIAALLSDRAPPEPDFDSVCYSLTAHDRALSIHGRFRVVDGEIRASPGAAESAAERNVAAEAERADIWYHAAIADSFGA